MKSNYIKVVPLDFQPEQSDNAEMLHNLAQTNSILSQFVLELRDPDIQKDRMRFRRNLERIGEIAAYEISRTLKYRTEDVKTCLGIAKCQVLDEQPVVATILRAGLPLHQGVLNYFDRADNAFVSAYRKHRADGSFDIQLEYLSSPALKDRIVILADPMLATGSSMVLTIKQLSQSGKPKELHIVTAIACQVGIAEVERHIPEAHIWAAAVDPELNDKAYIVPGLGDAGDLAYGEKAQR